MRLKLLLGALVAVTATIQLPALIGAQGADVRADYERAYALRTLVANKVYDAAEAPNWLDRTTGPAPLPASSDKFWYRKSVKGGNEFVLADAKAATKAAAFDHTRLAAAIGSAAGGTYTAVTLPFATFEYVDTM